MEGFFFDFPPGFGQVRNGATFRAFLSAAGSGDMRFQYGRENAAREEFLKDRGISPSRFIGIELAHSRKVLFAREQGDLRARKADGLFTDEINACLGITVSDCMPIWFLDTSSGAFGVLHSGWRGTGIALAAFECLGERYGTKSKDVSFMLGPHIGACCYEVGPEMAVQFMEEHGPETAECRDGRWFLDMRCANERLLRMAGIERIASIPICTSCDARMGSYRRQGKGGFTRMLAGIAAFAPRPAPDT